MERHKLLRISSQDRDNKSDSTSDFNVTISNKIELQHVKKIVVKQVSIPNTSYNIASDNNTFGYKIGAGPTLYTFTVPIGQYTIATLQTAVIAAFAAEAAPIVMTITLSALTGKLSWVSDTSIMWLNESDSSPLGEAMGITTSSTTASTTHTSASTPNLAGHNTLYIESSNMAKANLIRTNGQMSNVLCCIPITVEYGAIEHYLSPHPELDDIISSSSSGNNKQEIDIKIVSRDGHTVDLNGHHITLILKIYY